jgi:hypothetical protein
MEVKKFTTYIKESVNIPVDDRTWSWEEFESDLYYGIKKKEAEILQELTITKKDLIEHGTKLWKMKELSEYYGLKADVIKNITIEDVKDNIDRGIPSILLIQAWREYPDNQDWRTDYDDGHYAVAIGYNDTCVFFADPAEYSRTYLTYEELEDRWHDLDDDNKTKVSYLAVIITGEKKYDSKDIMHME